LYLSADVKLVMYLNKAFYTLVFVHGRWFEGVLSYYSQWWLRAFKRSWMRWRKLTWSFLR